MPITTTTTTTILATILNKENIMEHLEPVFRFLRHLPAILWFTLVALIQWFVPRSWYAKDVSNDIVLITGAGSGLGRSIALEYAKLNASLVLWDINASGLEETRELVEAQHLENAKKQKQRQNVAPDEASNEKRLCLTYVADVSEREEVYRLAKEVHKDLNKTPTPTGERYISVLVNNAGIYHGLYLQDLKDDQIERIFKINIMAHFWTVRAFLPKMIEHQRGHIVEIASMGGIGGLLKQVDYCATKFATVGFEESLSVELDHLGLGDKIYTTAICPFFFRSNLFTGFNDKAALIMSSKYVARETVMAMRCNHSMILLPRSSFILNLLRPITPRKALVLWTKVLGCDEGIKTIKGAAASL